MTFVTRTFNDFSEVIDVLKQFPGDVEIIKNADKTYKVTMDVADETVSEMFFKGIEA